VRRGLQQAGFEVERVEGFGRKREMVRGQLQSSHTPSPFKREGWGEGKPTRTILVIGGGIAGCAAAHALAQRGISVTLIERAPQLATQGSGNPRGILHARFGAGNNPLHRFVLAAYGHALALLDEAVPVYGALRSECGLLQLSATDAEAKRIAKLSAQEWPAHLLQAVDAATASELVGMKMVHGGLWFPGGGWVVPPQVCARLADHPLIVQRLGCEVTALERTASGWRASGEGFAIEAEQVVVCSGHQAKKLSQFAAFPLQPVRGQISILPATAASESLHAVLCAEGYCAPAVAGQHVAGATTTFDDAATDLREADHADNLAKIAAHMPALHQALNQFLPPCRGCGRVAAQPPGTHRRTPSGWKVSLACPEPGEGGVESQESNISTPTPARDNSLSALTPTLSQWERGYSRGGVREGGGRILAGRADVRCSVPGATPLVGEVEPGLYCSLAHGTRGLLTAGIAGEVIAAAMCGQLPPLPQSLLDALAPLPRVRNKGQCAT
jgi:tRNA U-34 5-methylaminomethyl-2-thiouridine biosynthesis protein MnmC